MSIPRSRFLALGLGAAAVFAVTGCGGDDPTDPGQDDDNDDDDDNGTGGSVQEISLTNSPAFSPATVTIAAGTVVRWTNDSSLAHTVTPDGHSEWSEWSTNAQGQTFQHTFNTPGTYPYFCVPHAPGMTGTIVVQ